MERQCRLPDMSNFCCLLGRAGGTPIGGLKEFNYDDAGTPLPVSFADYLLPTSLDVPDVEVLVFEDAPSPLNPLGVKGAGESGITGAGAAITSAINDAIETPGAVTRLPITPQRLRKILAHSR